MEKGPVCQKPSRFSEALWPLIRQHKIELGETKHLLKSTPSERKPSSPQAPLPVPTWFWKSSEEVPQQSRDSCSTRWDRAGDLPGACLRHGGESFETNEGEASLRITMPERRGLSLCLKNPDPKIGTTIYGQSYNIPPTLWKWAGSPFWEDEECLLLNLPVGVPLDQGCPLWWQRPAFQGQQAIETKQISCFVITIFFSFLTKRGTLKESLKVVYSSYLSCTLQTIFLCISQQRSGNTARVYH